MGYAQLTSVDVDAIPTGFQYAPVERQNLTMRMGMRRFTRLTNAFSRKVENHNSGHMRPRRRGVSSTAATGSGTQSGPTPRR
jgi:hypothetical protein